MKNIAKKITGLTLCIMLVFSSMTVSASDNLNDIEIEDAVQESIDAYDMEATATQLSEAEYQNLWDNRVAQQEEAIELLNSLEEESFQEIEVGEPLAVEIVDDQTENSVYYFFKGYENDMDETIVAMFIYEPTSDSLLVTSAEKVDADNNVDSYYEAINNEAMGGNARFNWVSFLCGLTSTVACGSFSAMLFAFVPASIAVGMSCSAAFSYVCSYA